ADGEDRPACAGPHVVPFRRPAAVAGQAPMLPLRELVQDPTGGEPVITVVEARGDEERTSRWRTVATLFEDAATFFPVLHEPEIWRLINLTEDTHPIHVHLDSFQVLGRHPAVVAPAEGGITPTGTSATVHIGLPNDDRIPQALDDNAVGL